MPVMTAQQKLDEFNDEERRLQEKRDKEKREGEETDQDDIEEERRLNAEEVRLETEALILANMGYSPVMLQAMLDTQRHHDTKKLSPKNENSARGLQQNCLNAVFKRSNRRKKKEEPAKDCIHGMTSLEHSPFMAVGGIFATATQTIAATFTGLAAKCQNTKVYSLAKKYFGHPSTDCSI